MERAFADKELFEGKTVTFLVPFRAGGGTDLWARFWASIIAKKLPGNPKVVVENITGGGSTKGANSYHKARKDGLTLFVSSASVMYPFLLGDRRVEYDFANWDALLVSPTGGVVYANHGSVDLAGHASFNPESVQKISLQGPTQIGVIMLLALDLLDVPYTVSFGASGAREIFRSFRQGRVTADMQTTASYKLNVEKLVEEGKAVPLFSLGALVSDGSIERDPNFPNLPHFLEYYEQVKGERAEGELVSLWQQLFIAGFPSQKMLLIDKNAPDGFFEAYEEAVEQTIANPEEWPNEHKTILGDYPQYIGKEGQELLARSLELDVHETAKIFADWLEEGAKIKI